MRSQSMVFALAASLAVFAPQASAETILGAYVFARHGDRTSKSTPPTELTSLGYQQVFTTGSYYHERYISSSSDSHILGISPDIVKPNQLAASAPNDEVLQKSTIAFLQALYPPVGNAAKSTLRNGTVVEAPMNGYQLVAVERVSTGGNSENVAWLQGASKCQKAKVSSKEYLSSKPYEELHKSTADFYKSIAPMVERTFPESEVNYKNAYLIWDLLNVARIHNATDSLPADKLPSDEAFARLQELANVHEFNLAYNASSPIRAVSGSLLAGEVLSGLKEVIDSAGTKTKLNVQFGAYAIFLSFFGLTKLAETKPGFTGVPDYASSMAFELVTNAPTSPSAPFPDPSEISVRFLFRNGSIVPNSRETEPVAYPLFGQSNTLMPWSEFESNMKKIAISTEQEFCEACSETPERCGAGGDGDDAANASLTGAGRSGGLSKVTAGVVGAFVTLAVILALQALAFMVGGFRLVKKADVKAIEEMEKSRA
ncbi:acid phosphatase [[Emmonsia] crescens]|uniref:Acid phosphatase n=1 Tax=[Emmonsia] crescens TaxID=73230 RepID=A0A0G2JAA9_9EURO|nr:acid phosphatase [Emmonsia crescens UAMH 3008]